MIVIEYLVVDMHNKIYGSFRDYRQAEQFIHNNEKIVRQKALFVRKAYKFGKE